MKAIFRDRANPTGKDIPLDSSRYKVKFRGKDKAMDKGEGDGMGGETAGAEDISREDVREVGINLSIIRTRITNLSGVRGLKRS